MYCSRLVITFLPRSKRLLISWLTPWKKAVNNLDSILKSRDIALPTKVHLVKAMAFPVVTYGCESWTIKKAEHWRTDAFELWCLRRLLRVPWTARRSCQSILKEINPEYSGRTDAESWSWSFNTLATWCKDRLIGKNSDAGEDSRQEEKEKTEDQMVGKHHRVDGHEFEQALGDGDRQGSLACCSQCSCKETHYWATEQQQQIGGRLFLI